MVAYLGKTNKVDEKGESTAQQQSTDRQDEGTDMPKVSTARTKLSTDKVEEGTAEPELRENTSSAAQITPTPTPTTFGNDETIAQVLLNMSQAKAISKEKEKGVEIRNAERPRTTSTRSVLTLKPLPKIDPNDKGKKRIEEDEESDTESKEITKAKKKFDQIAHDEEALYEKVKRFDDSFITIGSTEDERKIKEMNEEASDPDKKKKIVKEDVSAKVLAKQDVAEQGTKKRKGGHMKMIARKRKRPQPDVDSDDEHRKCLKIVTFKGTIDSEIMETKLFISKLDKVSSPEGGYLVVYRVNGNFRAFNYLMEGDLKIMIESSIEVTDQVDFSNDQQDWEIVTWRLYEACGVCILDFKDGTVIHMLVERKYPLSKELLLRMLNFGLEVEIESTTALDF
ncbi:hypothetical protein Tco_1175867 [Tanacetum coccineum]